MRRTFTILVTSTALTAVIGPPAWSAMRAAADAEADSRPFAALFEDGVQALPLIFASDDDDDGYRRHDDDDGHRRHGDDDDDDDGGRRPAPAGSVAPPDNGLFNTGTKPKVNSN